MISEEERRRRIDMPLDAIVSRMSSKEREALDRSTRQSHDQKRTHDDTSDRIRDKASSKREGVYIERIERGIYGDMTKVQLLQAHSELDEWSRVK